MKLRNPHDQPVTLPTLGLHVEARAAVEVTGQAAQALLAQGWARTGRPRKKVAARKKAAKGAAPGPSADKTTSGAAAPADKGD